MGAWGVGTFDNDAALDWVATLDEGEGIDVLRATFADTFQDEYLDADNGCAALAAAEVVAALAGKPAASLPDSVTNWVARVEIELTPTDIALARRSVERVRAHDSELLELWSEDDPGEFLEVLYEIEERLDAAQSNRST